METLEETWEDISEDEDIINNITNITNNYDDEDLKISPTIKTISIKPTKPIYPLIEELNWNETLNYKPRDIVIPPVIPSKNSTLFIDIKTSQKSKKQKQKQKQTQKQPTERKLVTDKRFDPWQQELSNKITDGYNIILDVATSCGKTWSVRTIIADHILSTNDTCLFITPNIEILVENYQSLLKDNRKTYCHSSQRMAGMQTINKTNTGTNFNCQFVFTTADNIISILTNNIFKEFLKKVKFIILDEVHIPEMQTALWNSIFIPSNPQYLLLSATLGDTTEVVENLNKYCSQRPTHLIKYNIRPIPLQHILFKQNIGVSSDGVNTELQDAFSYPINLKDPTIKDTQQLIELLDLNHTIPNNRTEQYQLGKSIIENLSTDDIQKIELLKLSKIDKMNNGNNINNILAVLQQLFSKKLNPIIIFNQSSSECISIAKNLLSLLQYQESNDKSLKKQFQEISKLEKKAKRMRDKEPERKHVNNAADANKNKPIYIPECPNKWRFPSNVSKLPGKIPEWINQLLQHGIGIHCKSIKGYIRRPIFNHFQSKNIQIIISDETLSAGVNLPVRTVILTGYINKVLYTHMSGRAGRRGHDTEGYVLPLLEKSNILEITNNKIIKEHIHGPKNMEVLSILQLNSNLEKNEIKKEIIKSYLTISSDECKTNYNNVLTWLKSNNFTSNSYTKLAIVLKNTKILLFVKLLQNGTIHQIANEPNSKNIILSLLSIIFITNPKEGYDNIFPTY